MVAHRQTQVLVLEQRLGEQETSEWSLYSTEQQWSMLMLPALQFSSNALLVA